MRFKELRITNFKAFKKTQRFVFPSKPGLYFMQGLNESEPRLGSNGAGKTTIWDALCWVLYGKTPKGLKSGDVCNWEAGKGAIVELDVEVGDGHITVVRQWSPIKCFIRWPDGTEEDMGKEQETPWLPYAQFLHCQLMAQNQPMFLDMKPEPQAALFAEVLQLDQWLGFAQAALRYVASYDKECATIERLIHETEGELKTLQGQDFAERAESWSSAQDKRIKELKDSYDAIIKRSTLKADLQETREKEARCRADLKDAIKLRPEARTCPECGQRIRADTENEDKARQRLENAEREHDQIQRAYEREQQDLDRLEEDIKTLTHETNPYYDLQRKQERDIQHARIALGDLQAALDDARYKQSLYAFWTVGFKEVRLYLISEAIEELEIEVNSAITALGLVDWELRFQIDRENKSGTITRGFSVFVKSPHNDKLVPWEAWSGGESQRLRIAATMGLADLIRSRAGTDIPLEIWDEATNNLSKEGAEDLLEALAWRAQQEQRVIFLVDHRALHFGDFAGYVNIIKTPSGSRIRQEQHD